MKAALFCLKIGLLSCLLVACGLFIVVARAKTESGSVTEIGTSNNLRVITDTIASESPLISPPLTGHSIVTSISSTRAQIPLVTIGSGQIQMAIPPNEFWVNFWANLLATLIGVGVGAPLGFWVDRQIKEREESKQQTRERNNRRSWSLKILHALEVEIEHNISILGDIINDLANNVVFGNIEMSSWNVTSPRMWEYLDNFDLLQQVSHLYSGYQEIHTSMSLQLSMHYSALLALENYGDLREGLVISIVTHAEGLLIEAREVLGSLREEMSQLRISNGEQHE